MMRNICWLLIISFPLKLFAQINVVPLPVEYEIKQGQFIIDKNTTVNSEGTHAVNSIEFLSGYLRDYYHLILRLSGNGQHTKNTISLIKRGADTLTGAYELTVTPSHILIESANDAGLFYGMQTLLQLLPAGKNLLDFTKLNVPCVSIKDRPRFSFRGMQLDVARHFFPVAYIKKYIDILALHKFNDFHIHLTDDQGWRIEIKKYPLLTKVGSCRDQTLTGRFGSDQYDGKKYCGYYTQEDIKEIVKYASDRYINIIPEIDVPGHSLAALAAYPFLGCTKGPYKVRETWGVQPDVFCAGNDSTYDFIENVLDEVMTLFPSTYIHIGGDECPHERWKKCVVCQKKMRELNLKDDHQLQSYFVQRVEKYVNSKGRKIIGWDEILEGGLAPNATVMSWRGTKGGIAAAKQSHNVIMSPESPLYLNHSQTKNEDSVTQGGYNPLEKVYTYEPLPGELNATESEFIKGIEGEVWTEYISNPSKLEYMLFPRISAVSEIAWSPGSKTWNLFENRLPGLMEKYKLWKVNFSTGYYDLQPSVLPGNNNTITWQLLTKAKGKIIYCKSDSPGITHIYDSPIVIDHEGKWGATLTDTENNTNPQWVWQLFQLNKASGQKITLTYPPNSQYSGQGGFTLVDGVQNSRGMLKAYQFVGFINSDFEATIDLGEIQNISKIILHAFEQKPSWIYAPTSVSFEYSSNGIQFAPFPPAHIIGSKNITYTASLICNTRYIKVKAANIGTIKEGLPGAGNKGWLFLDEIEIF